MKLYVRLLKEGFAFAFQALIVNKLRTFLSLLGVTIGIFAIVSVFTLVDSLERNIRGSIETLGTNIVFVQKWPWSFGGNYAWWEYMMRPEVKQEELKKVQERTTLASHAAYVIEFRRTLKQGNSSIENQKLVAASKDYRHLRNFSLWKGRYFTDEEFRSGAPFCVIGARTAYDLFGIANPIGKRVKLGGKKATVIGVFEYEGESLINVSVDQETHIPIQFAKKLVNINDRRLGPRLMVKAKAGVPNEALIDELTGIMRSIRSLKPKQETNFALNEISILSEGFEGFFGFISLIGSVIGGFSILVGGFSIANIMYVSVKERTGIIGIQKSLGAKNAFILFQFLTESVVLTLLGGVFGLVLIFIITFGISSFTDYEITMSLKNVLTGVGLSIGIGLIAGLLPARTASRLDPVEAMRAN